MAVYISNDPAALGTVTLEVEGLGTYKGNYILV